MIKFPNYLKNEMLFKIMLRTKRYFQEIKILISKYFISRTVVFKILKSVFIYTYIVQIDFQK